MACPNDYIKAMEARHDDKVIRDINKEADRMLATPEHTYSAIVVVWCIISALLILLFASVAKAEVYDAETIANAIYKAEGGARAVKPYGVLSVSCTGEADCRRVCLNTIENNFVRWQLAGSRGDYLEFLARRYAPVGASNDPNGLNVNWLNNVRYFIEKEGK